MSGLGGDRVVPSALTCPRPAGSAALLNPGDPFLPQPEDAALPAVNSLFAAAADFPPLHIDANDFQ